MGEPVRARRLTDEEGRRLQQIVRRGNAFLGRPSTAGPGLRKSGSSGGITGGRAGSTAWAAGPLALFPG